METAKDGPLAVGAGDGAGVGDGAVDGVELLLPQAAVHSKSARTTAKRAENIFILRIA